MTWMNLVRYRCVVIGRANINKVEGIKPFLEELYGSCGATFNIKSGRADRKGTKDVELYGYRKCIMQVHNPNFEKPRMKGLQKDCQAELNFKMDKPMVNLILKKFVRSTWVVTILHVSIFPPLQLYCNFFQAVLPRDS